MVLSILKWLGIAMVLSFIALWLWEGGYWKIAKLAEVVPNPLESTTTDLYQLPGQPDFWEVPDTTSGADDMEYGASDYENPSDALYDAGAPAPGAERSPYAGYVELAVGGARSPDASAEYLTLRAGNGVTLPIDVSGWSLRSLFTGTRAVIPMAASPFVLGVVNSVEPISLAAGDSVVISSGMSPVGVSFEETMCTGYLAATQQFYPPLSNACPRASDLLPRTQENAARYGNACIDFAERLAPCSYPSIVPNDVSSACRSYLQNAFTYNGCMRAYGSRSNLSMHSWRAYESSGSELWQNEHDSVVLYDSEGRTVGTLSY